MTAPDTRLDRMSTEGLEVYAWEMLAEVQRARAELERRQATPEQERLKRRHRRRRVDSLGRVWRGHLFLAYSAEGDGS